MGERLAHGIPVALSIGAATFFIAGPWLVHTLTDYGFSWSPTVMQQLAWLLAWLMSLPTGLIVDSLEPSRILLAINGAIWGGLLYSGWMLVVVFRQGKRLS
jgi:hypothetical protein